MTRGNKVPAPNKAQEEEETGRIVPFPTRVAPGKGEARSKNADEADIRESQVEDLRKYERDGEPNDYLHRMIVNLIAFAFIVALTLAGIWIAEQMALMRRNQDCVLSGRKNCLDIGAVIHNR
jgi:hypothetical protein